MQWALFLITIFLFSLLSLFIFNTTVTTEGLDVVLHTFVAQIGG